MEAVRDDRRRAREARYCRQGKAGRRPEENRCHHSEDAKMKLVLALAFALATVPAFAQQQQLDAAAMQRGLNALQAQRNQAMDVAASQEVRAAGLAEELAKAQ